MAREEIIKQFEAQKIRTYWDDEQEKWYFCINDVVEVLTETTNPSNYLKQLRHRDKELSKGWLQIVTPLSLNTSGGIQRVNCASVEGVFRSWRRCGSCRTHSF